MLKENQNRIKTSYIEAKYKSTGNHTHFHNDYSIVYIVEGTHIFENDIAKYEIEENTIRVINQNEHHKTHDSDFKYINFLIPKEFILEIAKEQYGDEVKKVLFTSIIKDQDIVNILLKLKRIITSVSFNQYEFDMNMKLFVKAILRKYTFELNFHNFKKKQNIIKQVKKYVEENFEDKISLEDLEEYLEISKFQIIREFKRKINMSPIRYTYIIRTNIAKKMIDESELSLSEIAYTCGFPDQSNMIKNFKKVYNYTPNSIKKNSKSLNY